MSNRTSYSPKSSQQELCNSSSPRGTLHQRSGNRVRHRRRNLGRMGKGLENLSTPTPVWMNQAQLNGRNTRPCKLRTLR